MKTLKPETIANLNIVWTFNQNQYDDLVSFLLDFQRLNPNIPNYKIVPRTYLFIFNSEHPLLGNKHFRISIYSSDRITTLMFFIHFQMNSILNASNIKSLELSRFIKIDDSTFKIEENLPF